MVAGTILLSLRVAGVDVRLAEDGRRVETRGAVPAHLAAGLRAHRDAVASLLRIEAELGRELADRVANVADERAEWASLGILPVGLLDGAALLERVEHVLRRRGPSAGAAFMSAIYRAAVVLDVAAMARAENQ